MPPMHASRSPVLATIADWRRRTTLALLRDRASPLSEERVATYLAVQEHEKPPEKVTPDELKSDLLDLRHAQLPLLEEHGFVKWDKEEAIVTLSDHPVLDDSTFNRILNLDEDGLDDVLAMVSQHRRRLLLRLLKKHQRDMSRTELAEAILQAEADTTDPDPHAVNEVIAVLYHNHLPKLADVGLIEYDSDIGKARYTEHPALEEVFSILYLSDTLIERLDDFIEELEVTARETSDRIGTKSDLPKSWTTPHYG